MKRRQKEDRDWTKYHKKYTDYEMSSKLSEEKKTRYNICYDKKSNNVIRRLTASADNSNNDKMKQRKRDRQTEQRILLDEHRNDRAWKKISRNEYETKAK